MKMLVITDSDGMIRATAPAKPQASGKDAPVGLAVHAGAGHLAHRVDVPREAADLSPLELVRRYRVSLKGRARLVRLPPAGAKPKAGGKPPAGAKP